MDSARKVFQIAKIYVVREFKNYKNYCIIAVVYVLIGSYMTGTIDYVKESENLLSPWLLPFIMEFVELRLVVYAGFLLFISSSIVGVDITSQLIIRSKNLIYQIGRMVSLIVQSLVYAILVTLSGIVMNLPYIQFEKGWGKVLYSLSDPSVSGIHLQTLVGDAKILYELTPVQGMLLSFLLLVLTCVFLAMIIYFFSEIIGKKSLGMILGGISIFLDLAVPNLLLNLNSLLLLSPLTCSNLGIMRVKGYSSAPHVNTGIVYLFSLIAILAILDLIISKKVREKIYG